MTNFALPADVAVAEAFPVVNSAEQLGRHHSTIYRELSRNHCYYNVNEDPRYLPNLANTKAFSRRKRDLKLMEQPELKAQIINYLKQC